MELRNEKRKKKKREKVRKRWMVKGRNKDDKRNRKGNHVGPKAFSSSGEGET